jgi:homoserine kinase type II
MAVYTVVSHQDLGAFLRDYDIGTLLSHEGITQGVSNTNYFITTTTGRYVLTLFEPNRVRVEDIPAFIGYAVRLSQSGVPCPETMARKDGTHTGVLCDRPAAIFSLLEGEGGTPAMLTPALCEKAEVVLAKMHLAATGLSVNANHFGLVRWKNWIAEMGAAMNQISDGLYDVAAKEIAFLETEWPQNLPRGAIHADYFPDNVFFKEGDISGVIDFHFVCDDMFVYDLAITVNAWCFDAGNDFRAERMEAMIRGYESVRPLSRAEKDALPLLCRAASLRFLLSRLDEKLKWREGDFMVPHDPMVFEKRLRHFQGAQ